MIVKTKIICPHCHNDTGMCAEDYSHYVMTSDIRCPRCGSVVIHYNPVLCRSR